MCERAKQSDRSAANINISAHSTLLTPHRRAGSQAWKADGIAEAWKASSWARKLARKEARKNLGDFDRFKVMVARKQKSKIIASKMKSMKA